MTWCGSTTPQDRLFACLPYLLPLTSAVIWFSADLVRQFPPLQAILLPIALYLGPITNGILGMVLFFALFLLVVRNLNISHFVRFNTMQALLVDILLVLFSFALSILGQGLGGPLITILANTFFLGTVAIFVYAVVQSLLGRYAEIPTLSEAVYAQVR